MSGKWIVFCCLLCIHKCCGDVTIFQVKFSKCHYRWCYISRDGSAALPEKFCHEEEELKRSADMHDGVNGGANWVVQISRLSLYQVYCLSTAVKPFLTSILSKMQFLLYVVCIINRAVVSERLRSRAANLVGWARVSSNLINREKSRWYFFCFKWCRRCRRCRRCPLLVRPSKSQWQRIRRCYAYFCWQLLFFWFQESKQFFFFSGNFLQLLQATKQTTPTVVVSLSSLSIQL